MALDTKARLQCGKDTETERTMQPFLEFGSEGKPVQGPIAGRAGHTSEGERESLAASGGVGGGLGVRSQDTSSPAPCSLTPRQEGLQVTWRGPPLRNLWGVFDPAFQAAP